MTAPGPRALAIARAALRRGPLMPCRSNHFRCGQRRLTCETVNVLLRAGEAERQGRLIVRRQEAQRPERAAP